MKGHVRRRGVQSYAIVIDLGRTQDGRRKQKWHSVKGTKKDAERKLVELLHSLSTGRYVEPSRLKLADLLTDWINDCACHQVCGKTLERYKEIVEKHLIP